MKALNKVRGKELECQMCEEETCFGCPLMNKEDEDCIQEISMRVGTSITLKEFLANATTFDEMPAMHGKWENADIISAGLLLRNRQNIVEHRCSICGRYSIRFEGHVEESYCPYCGTKMNEVCK